MTVYKQDLNTVIELVDILSYALEKNPRLFHNATVEEKELIHSLQDSVDNYRTDNYIKEQLQQTNTITKIKQFCKVSI